MEAAPIEKSLQSKRPDEIVVTGAAASTSIASPRICSAWSSARVGCSEAPLVPQTATKPSRESVGLWQRASIPWPRICSARTSGVTGCATASAFMPAPRICSAWSTARVGWWEAPFVPQSATYPSRESVGLWHRVFMPWPRIWSARVAGLPACAAGAKAAIAIATTTRYDVKSFTSASFGLVTASRGLCTPDRKGLKERFAGPKGPLKEATKRVEFRILGPLEVEEHGQALEVAGAKHRALLALLLLHGNETVARDRLIEELWGGNPPDTAATALQVHVSKLRKLLGPDVIVTRAPGYRIQVGEGDLDLGRFEKTVARAQAAGAAEAAALLGEALALWRGVPFAELDAPFARAERARLTEQRLWALEQRIDADLELGRNAELVPELERLVHEHPLRERLRGQLMLALYRAGRQADALDAYRAGRRLLDEELGLEPGEELRRLERAILGQDGSLSAAPAPATPRRAEQPAVVRPARQQRKTVTLVFCDLAESTALGDATDPEVLEGRLRRYFERMEAIVERHGGTVEKFIGDAVMAVFGVPVAHEDDALRGLRAAAEMRDALPELELQARIGVNTGEILTSKRGTLVTGDAVNVAARLEQAAAPGEVLVGAETRALVGPAAEAEEVEPLTLKGKPEPVPAFRLVAVGEAPTRAHDRPFVGRDAELALLRTSWERTNAEAACELVTVVGEAGVGKSRLVAEALAGMDARIVRARCLPYGENITYWPVVEVIKQLGTLPSDPTAAAAIRSLLGESAQVASVEEIAWAFRKLVTEQAPLLVLFDDIQWGADTFLDLVENVPLLAAGAPLVLLCIARPELLDRRPAWPVAIRLQPLGDADVAALIGDRIEGDLRARIERAAGGNPLFVTEMLAMAREGDIEVPPTLRALLTARLDQLEPHERSVLERGAVEGEIFHRGAVQTLSPDEPHITPRLAALVRRELIRPHAAQLPGDEGFRFRHLLIRDAAYDGLPKAVRADLHGRFADWLEQQGALVELDDLVGYHLEQAAQYLDELGRPDTAVALRAADRLGAAGRRALFRGDERAAAGVLERALTLSRPLRSDIYLELDFAQSLWHDSQRAAEVMEDAAVRALATGDETGEALCRAMVLFFRSFTGKPGSIDDLETALLDVRGRLERAEDHLGLSHIWTALGYGVANTRGRIDDWALASEEAQRHSRLAGLPGLYQPTLGTALITGSRPADEALEQVDRLIAEIASPWLRLNRAWLLAMLNRLEEAHALAAQAYGMLVEMTTSRWADWTMAEMSILTGDYEDATRRLRMLCDWLEATDQRGLLESYLPLLGRWLCQLGRFDEAEPLAQR